MSTTETTTEEMTMTNVKFDLREYECVWFAGGEEDAGFVAIRVDATGSDDADWLESDVVATSVAQAQDIARMLIDQHEDALKEDPSPPASGDAIDGIYEALRADLRYAQTTDAVERALSAHFEGAYLLCLDAQGDERDEAMALDSAREIVSACADGRWTFDFDDATLAVRHVEVR